MAGAEATTVEAPHETPASLPFFAEAPRQRWWSGWHLVELVAVFCLGLALMGFFYTQPGQPADQWGVPGYDSFYHIKMAELMPEIGLVDRFDWLRTTIFYKDRFVSHHWGFQAFLIPFITAAKWLGHDALVGARWAIAVFFGLVMVAFHLLLQSERVRFRWMWLGLFLAMPAQFFSRHAFIRAIDLSLLCMLLLIFWMFRRRYVAAGLTIAVYIHIYLGGLLYAPVIVGAYFIAGLLAPRGERVSWKLVFWTTLGWVVGLVTHPYADGAIGFLKLQVFGSGLTPDIPVGREWKSYDVYFFLRSSGPMWVVLAAAICVRLRFGRRTSAKEMTLLLINFAFLLLVCKSRRFIEYWPVFNLLAAAALVAPVLREWVPDPAGDEIDRVDPSFRRILAVVMGVACAILIATCITMLQKLKIERFVAEWPLWALPVALYFLAPIGWWLVTTRSSSARGIRAGTLITTVAAGAALLVILTVTLRFSYSAEARQPSLLRVSWWLWAAVGALYLVVPIIAMKWTRAATPQPPGRRISTAIAVFFTAASFVLLMVLMVAGQLVDLQKSVSCGFNLPAVRRAMDFLKAESPPGSVVFTDDWDIFPLYFYHNHHNHYIVGLDPKFTHEADPELWERYVKVSRGEFPKTVELKSTGEDGRPVYSKIDVKIDDIVDHFDCSYVVTDRDHAKLARKLEAAPEFAKRIYPPRGSIDDVHRPPYKVFRVLKPPAQVPTTTRVADQS